MRAFLVGLGLALGLISANAMAADEVKLNYAYNEVLTGHGVTSVTYQTLKVEALVKNLAYVKQVEVYAKDSTGVWTLYPLSYNRSADAGREIWSTAGISSILYSNVGLIAGSKPFITEYVLKYTVNGQVYWDNNAGTNFKIVGPGASYLSAPVMNVARVDSYTASVGYGLNIATWLKNIAMAKTVNVVYTTNNWATSARAPLQYQNNVFIGYHSVVPSPNAANIEYWAGYPIPVQTAGKTVKYYIEYTVNGVTYRDTNFGKNYTVTFN